MIELHSASTPNSQKVVICLEETGLPFRRIGYDMLLGDHLTPNFRAINPNCKVPAIVDLEPADGGDPFPVFESGAILLYLADKTGALLPAEPRARSRALQWLVWQAAGLGPMHGQAGHFVRYAPAGQDYAVARYMKEEQRLLHVLDYRLTSSPYLAGEAYSIADIACWPWIDSAKLLDFDLAAFPALHRWWRTVGARPAVIRAVHESDVIPEAMTRKRMELTPEQWSNVFGDAMHGAARSEPLPGAGSASLE